MTKPPLPTMRPVYSTHIQSIGYVEGTGEVYVRFKSGKLVVYEKVDRDIAFDIFGAPSIGKALRAIRDTHAFRYVEADDA